MTACGAVWQGQLQTLRSVTSLLLPNHIPQLPVNALRETLEPVRERFDLRVVDDSNDKRDDSHHGSECEQHVHL
jgi:hypothetical protein